jgi:predicted phage terminase large subunit-like protein
MSTVAVPQVFTGYTEKQLEFIQAPSWLRAFIGGRGSAKTYAGSLDILWHARAGDPYMVISPSFPMLFETTWPTFKQVCHSLGVWVRGVMTPIPTATFLCQGGGTATATFRTGENPEALRGPSKAGLWLDEAGIMPKAVYDIAIPTLRHEGRMGRLTITTTPKGKRHWIFAELYWIDDQGKLHIKPDVSIVKATTRDNPFLPPEFYAKIRARYTSQLAQQELEGEFIDVAGLLFQRDWFGFTDSVPREADRVRYWDKAATESVNAQGEPQESAFTAGLLLARCKKTGDYFVEHVVRGQWSWFERNRIMREVAASDAARYDNQVQIFAEQEPGSGGKESMLVTIRELEGFNIRRDLVSRGKRERLIGGEKLPGEAKVIRAHPVAAQCEARRVKILRNRPWVPEFLDELCAFPMYAQMDQVDSLSGAFNMLVKYFGPVHGHIPTRTNVGTVESARYGILVTDNENQQKRQTEQPTRMNQPGWFMR